MFLRAVVFSNLRAPRFRLLPAALGVVCVLAALMLSAGDASAQSFQIDLERLTEIYDELFPERTRTAVWDTTRAYDFEHIVFGNQRYLVPHFIPARLERRKTTVDWLMLPGYRLTYTYAPLYSFDENTTTVGGLDIPVPRDFDVPGIEFNIAPMDSVIEDIRRHSLAAAWREAVVASVTAQQLIHDGGGRGGIVIKIPVPMPRQLESIFGPSDKTHIKITGRESITISGETRKVDPFIGVEGRTSQSLFPSLDMKQELDVSLTGTIGDKVNVRVDHSSQQLDANANRINVNYVGYEDDVIKLIELGNTSLSLPGSQLVNFSTQSKGLFGVKVLAQLGSTDLTFIASKQQGESSSANFSPTGGNIGQAETRILRDLDYVRNKYFYFDHPSAFVGASQAPLFPEVWRTVTARDLQTDPSINRTPGRAFVDRDGFGTDINAAMTQIKGGLPPPPNIQNNFKLLQKDIDYFYLLDTDSRVVGVELAQPLSDTEKSLGVSYVNIFGARVGGTYTDFGVPGDTLVLELIRPRNARPEGEFGWTWAYELRNIYNLGLSNIDPVTFTLEIHDRLNPRLDQTVPEGLTQPIPYIRIFGLDRKDQQGKDGPDGRVDISNDVINLNAGLLAFPVTITQVAPPPLSPPTAGEIAAARAAAQSQVAAIESGTAPRFAFTGFAPDTNQVRTWTDGGFSFSGRYLPQYQLSRRLYTEYLTDVTSTEVQQYTIRVTAVSATKTFRLDAFNIIENSEVVMIDGQRLARETDYNINYETGEVELKGGALERLSPDSKISIDYEFTPFGGGGSSNLIGVGTISKLGDDARLGTTWLYESKTSTGTNVRLNEEPTRAIVAGINGSWQRQANFLTDLINKMPLVDTDAPSTININGEVAASVPDPNVRGEAYIDDFEGTEDSDRFSMTRRGWYWASPPILATDDGLGSPLPVDGRIPFIYYNSEPKFAVTKLDLNPNLDKREDSSIAALNIDLDVRPASADTSSWAGIMTGFQGGGLDLSQGQFIEIWVNDFKQDPLKRGGSLHIDMGTIDENFFEPVKGQFNDEDRDRDGFAAAFDDTGLDGLFNQVEPDSANATGNPGLDSNGDDLDLSPIAGRFSKVNGTEGNRAYDTEDLDGNTQLDRVNSYFSYEIPLASVAVVDIHRDFPNYTGFNDAGHQNDAWRLYRVKLADAKIVSSGGQAPRLDQIRHLRIWFHDANRVIPDSSLALESGRRIQIAEFKIQGNRWILDRVRDLADQPVDSLAAGTEFTIGVISNKTDPGIYTPPIRPREVNQIGQKESSLALAYDRVVPGNQVRIRKEFPGEGIDMILYRDLHFWVHTDSIRPDMRYYFRVATTEKNYYEVQLPLTAEYFERAPGWTRVSISVAGLTNLKFETADSAGVVMGFIPDIGGEGVAYPVRLVGNPSLLNVRYLYAGVRNVNPDAFAPPVSGEIWIDDFYVGNVRRDVDFAQRIGATLNVAGGVISLGGSWNRTGPDYRGLRQRRGSGSLSQSVVLNGKTDLRYFIPLFGFQIPINGNYGRTTSIPKFTPNSDTEIASKAIRDSLSTITVTEQFGTSLTKRGSKNVLLRYTIDKMTSNFSYAQTKRASPASTDTSAVMSGGLGYQINWSAKKHLNLLGAKFRWWLNSMTLNVTANRRTGVSWRNLGGVFVPNPTSYAATMTQSGTFNYQPFNSLSSSFNMNVNRDVADENQWLGVNIGTETNRTHSLRIGWDPEFKLVKPFDPSFEVTTNYNEDSSPNVRRPEDPEGTRTVNASRNLSLRTRFDVGHYFSGLFDVLGWDPEASGVGGTSLPAPPPPVLPDAPAGSPPDTTSGPVGVLPPQTVPAVADTTAPRRRGDPMVAVRKLGAILTDLRRLNVSGSRRRGSGYTRIPNQPTLAYRLGWTSDSGISGPDGPINVPEQLTTTTQIQMDSGVLLAEDFDVQGRYSIQITDTDFRAAASRTKSTTWPDIQVNWRGLERFGLFRRYFALVNANFNFRRSATEAGVKNAPPNNRTSTLNMAPALQLSWKNDISTQVGVVYGKSDSRTRGAGSETTNFGVTLDLRKSFRGGQGFKIPIPFLSKRVQWSSQLDAHMQVAYSRTGGKRFTEGSDFFEPIPASTSLRVAPDLSYNFSQAVNGRVFIDYGRGYSQATNQTTTTLRLGVNVVFTF